MASWAELERAAPDLSRAIVAQFRAHKHALIATVRRDGSPRISGIETTFRDGELWLAMMPDSRKADDLARDPRFALHSAPLELDLVNGDAKVNGRALAVRDGADLERFVAALEHEMDPSEVSLFRADVTEASLTRVENDWLVVDSWREGRAPRRRRRK